VSLGTVFMFVLKEHIPILCEIDVVGLQAGSKDVIAGGQSFKCIHDCVVAGGAEMAGCKQRRVVAFGERLHYCVRKADLGAAIRLKQMWNNLLKTHNFLLRCAYPLTCSLDKNYMPRYAMSITP
jgi:hypothetical protein